MKISFDNQVMLDQKYTTFDDLIDPYRNYETKHGRAVPPYALDALLGAIAIWLLQQAASRTINWLLSRREKQREKKRADEIIQRLERLEGAINARMSSTDSTTLDGIDIADTIRDSGIKTVIILETETERDLSETLRKLFADAQNVEIRIA